MSTGRFGTPISLAQLARELGLDVPPPARPAPKPERPAPKQQRYPEPATPSQPHGMAGGGGERDAILVAGHLVPYSAFLACSFDPSAPALAEQLGL